MEKSEITLKAQCDFHDKELWNYVSRLEERIKTLNDRTKNHTLQIRDLQKRIKLMEVKNGRKLQT